jgi:hypothetical protein
VDDESAAYLPVESATSGTTAGIGRATTYFGALWRSTSRLQRLCITSSCITTSGRHSSLPLLVNVTVDGKPIKAVVQPTKQGYARLDRVTGSRCGPSKNGRRRRPMRSEWTAATQPIR